MLWKSIATPALMAMCLAGRRLAGANTLEDASMRQPNEAEPIRNVRQRDTSDESCGGTEYFFCDDANPGCRTAGTPCTDGTVRTGPTLCSNTPVFVRSYDLEGDEVSESYLAVDSTCACIQDGQFTSASYANIMDLLRTDPKAQNSQNGLCEFLSIDTAECYEAVSPAYIYYTYFSVSGYLIAI